MLRFGVWEYTSKMQSRQVGVCLGINVWERSSQYRQEKCREGALMHRSFGITCTRDVFVWHIHQHGIWTASG